MKIPQIIHQIWSDVDEPLPPDFKELGDTWKRDYPDWEYKFWNNERIDKFILEYYPQYWDIYNKFSYNMQRWDAIRYLILDKEGGMYVDFDYESISPLDEILKGKTCCFASEPREHAILLNKNIYISNSLMASIPSHPFIKILIEKMFQQKGLPNDIALFDDILKIPSTARSLFLTNIYEHNKRNIYIIPETFVSPINKHDALILLSRTYDSTFRDYMEIKLNKACAIHYFIEL